MSHNTFYENLERICRERKISPSAAANAIGFSNASATKWKQGSVPRAATIKALAEVLGCSVDDLTKKATIQTDSGISDEEYEIIQAYRIADPKSRDLVRFALWEYMVKDKTGQSASNS